MYFYVEEIDDSPIGPTERPAAVLRRDRWDDYGYKTTFWLTLFLPGSSLEVGTVKILHKDQTSGQTPMSVGRFTVLGPDYCSLGQSLSYYEKLHQAGRAIRDEVLAALRDVVANPSIGVEFESAEGFATSLERNGSASRAMYDAAPLLSAGAQRSHGEALEVPFRTTVGGSAFTVPLAFNKVAGLPGRMNAIIGYNGTGKTRLLANLAWTATTDLAKRGDVVETHGFFARDPEIAFGAVIAISYSAFDTFEIPGTGRSRDAAERVQREGEFFGYVYCGLRSLEQSEDGTDRLKSIPELLDDTLRALNNVRAHREQLLRDAIAPLVREPSFSLADFTLSALNSEAEFSTAFGRLSTGHKIILNIVLQLIAHTQLKSLVLFDEPECHLHPPLLAALLKSIGIVLEDRDSYAVIATHSPVVLQEIPRRYVHVLQRFGLTTTVDRPEEETFGENVGYLTKSIFSLDSRTTDYHSVLEDLVMTKSNDEIDDLFDGGMSGQARAYVEGLRRGRR